MGKPLAPCPKCGLPVDLRLRDYVGPHRPRAQVRCPHCASWLLLSLRARLLGAATAFAIVFGVALAMTMLGAPHWPRYVSWLVATVAAIGALYLGARVIRAQANWQLPDYGG